MTVKGLNKAIIALIAIGALLVFMVFNLIVTPYKVKVESTEYFSKYFDPRVDIKRGKSLYLRLAYK
jgi:hypothetical protein